MTILAPTPNTRQHANLLTGADVLAIEKAIRNVAHYGKQPDAADRQALALLTYDRHACKALAALLIERILDGTYTLPLDKRCAWLLMRLAWRLPAVSATDEAIYSATSGGVWSVIPPCEHDDARADLAHVPHSITVEPVTPELRNGTDLPDGATLVVVERHAGILAKVCDSTDAHVADYVEWGYKVTIEDVARGIAATYGATYVEAPAVNA